LNTSDSSLAEEDATFPFIKRDCYVGQKWTKNDKTRKVASMTAAITVPADNYDSCIKINQYYELSNEIQMVIYYRKNIGIIYAGHPDEFGGFSY
jgi:hypothetical protein